MGIEWGRAEPCAEDDAIATRNDRAGTGKSQLLSTTGKTKLERQTGATRRSGPVRVLSVCEQSLRFSPSMRLPVPMGYRSTLQDRGPTELQSSPAATPSRTRSPGAMLKP